MDTEENRLASAVNQLATLTVMVDPEDLVTLGKILEETEEIHKTLAGSSYQSIQDFTGALQKLAEKIILRDVADATQAIKVFSQGVRILQDKIARPQPSGPTKEEEHFWEKWRSLLGKDAPPLSGEGKQSSAEDPPGEETFDLTQDREIYTDFIAEGMEHLATIELNIINLEQTPGDVDCLNSVFRPFHTIKGVSGFLNLKDMNRFAHAMESLLDDARNKKLRICREIIDFILEAVDLLKRMIQDLKCRLEAGTNSLSRFELAPYFERIEKIRRGELSAPPVLESTNRNEDAASNPAPLGEILSSKGIISSQDVKEALIAQSEGKKDLKLGEILVQKNKATSKQVIEALRDQKRASGSVTEATVKVDTQKLDNLVDMVGELVIAQSLVQQNPAIASVHDQKLTRDFSQLKRITSDLQKISMSLRMVPIRQTFQKMIRLVRDLANKSQKQVDLIMSGEETEIDRNMVDLLYDPLVHMIRNSVDHGIEPPLRRQEVGKPETGKIFLRAFQKGGYIIIEIEDDGQGLNRAKILKKAQEKGLVPVDTVLTEYQIDNLIFEAGFSTAEKVTDVSGRGVGMDVVKRTIEKLKGIVEIFSTEGKGCRFVMRVPLTLAIMDGIVVRVGEERYVIPTVFIRETLRPDSKDLVTVHQRGEVIKVRESLLPLVRLYQHLGVTSQTMNPWEALVVVVENEGKQKGLMVDDLIGKQEVVIKNLGEKLKTVKGVAGATIMGDGRVGLILDMHGIFEIAQSNN